VARRVGAQTRTLAVQAGQQMPDDLKPTNLR
jgi:hypothetical protein